MDRYDGILLLGLQLRPDGTAQEELVKRIRLAAVCYRAGLAADIIACGGCSGAQVSEAQVMTQLLIREGVPQEHILQEDRSKITCENIRNALGMLNESRNVLLVTSDYHMFRAKVIYWRESGVWPKGKAVCTPFGSKKIKRWKVEFYALADYLFFWGGRDEERPEWAEKLKRFLLRRNRTQ